MRKLLYSAVASSVIMVTSNSAPAQHPDDKPIMPGMIKEQPAEAAKPKVKRKMDHVGGCVISVDPKTKTVVIENRQGEKIAFVADQATQFVKDKKYISITDIKVKDHLSVAFSRKDDGKMEVVMMMVSEESSEAFCRDK